MGLNTSIKVLPEYLQEAGYSTHLGEPQQKCNPWKMFSVWVGWAQHTSEPYNESFHL